MSLTKKLHTARVMGTTCPLSRAGGSASPSMMSIRIAKQTCNDSKLDRSDVVAVHKLVEKWQAMGEKSPLVHFQPQVQ